MPLMAYGLAPRILMTYRKRAGHDQADVAALIPCADGSGEPWPRALLSMVENGKARVRGLTPMYLAALAALDHVRAHEGCSAFLGGCGRIHLDCTRCACMEERRDA